MKLQIRLYNYHYRFIEYFPVALVFFTSVAFISYLFSITITDKNEPIRFIYFLIPFIFGVFIFGFFTEKYLLRSVGTMLIDSNGIIIKTSKAPVKIKINQLSDITIHYINPKSLIQQWGRLGTFFKYRSVRYCNKTTLDRISINGLKYYLKIKSKKDIDQFEQLIEIISKIFPERKYYYSSYYLKNKHGDDYVEEK